jgi:sulfane dehydrogenase subunit SoxC
MKDKQIQTETSESRVEMEQDSHQGPLWTRRHLLKGGMLAGATSLIPSLAQGTEKIITPLEIPTWTKQQGMPTGTLRYGLPSSYEKHVVRTISESAQPSRGYTPLQELHSIITPNGLFFQRNHAGIPDIDPHQHRLVIHGMVEKATMFTMEDILRLPAVSKFYFLECAGNTQKEWEIPEKEGRTVQDTHGLLSCCQWTGVPLSTLLHKVGIKNKAAWILAEGADGAAMTRSIPVDPDNLDQNDCLIVYAQNGERLRPEQGYPIRLLVPGCEGNMNIKWLRRLEVSDQPFMTREETSKYTDLITGTGTIVDGKARQFTFTMEVKSVITSPSGGQQLDGSGYYEIRGIAWSGRGRIKQVEVSVDGGKNWREARLDGPILPKCFTFFRCGWHRRENGQPVILMSRARDESGWQQPTLSELVKELGVNSVYHNNAIYGWLVKSTGEVTNVVRT